MLVREIGNLGLLVLAFMLEIGIWGDGVKDGCEDDDSRWTGESCRCCWVDWLSLKWRPQLQRVLFWVGVILVRVRSAVVRAVNMAKGGSKADVRSQLLHKACEECGVRNVTLGTKS